MKRFALLLLAILAAFVAVGCGKSEPAEETPAPAATATDETKTVEER